MLNPPKGLGRVNSTCNSKGPPYTVRFAGPFETYRHFNTQTASKSLQSLFGEIQFIGSLHLWGGSLIFGVLTWMLSYTGRWSLYIGGFGS